MSRRTEEEALRAAYRSSCNRFWKKREKSPEQKARARELQAAIG